MFQRYQIFNMLRKEWGHLTLLKWKTFCMIKDIKSQDNGVDTRKPIHEV